jgi:hypothetical protein
MVKLWTHEKQGSMLDPLAGINPRGQGKLSLQTDELSLQTDELPPQAIEQLYSYHRC